MVQRFFFEIVIKTLVLHRGLFLYRIINNVLSHLNLSLANGSSFRYLLSCYWTALIYIKL